MLTIRAGDQVGSPSLRRDEAAVDPVVKPRFPVWMTLRHWDPDPIFASDDIVSGQRCGRPIGEKPVDRSLQSARPVLVNNVQPDGTV